MFVVRQRKMHGKQSVFAVRFENGRASGGGVSNHGLPCVSTKTHDKDFPLPCALWKTHGK
jgi:hypothetical protein